MDLTKEPLGQDQAGNPVFLEEIMPSREEIEDYVDTYVTRQLFQKEYAQVFSASERWNRISTDKTHNYHWDKASTYIQNPPYFDQLADELTLPSLDNLKVLAKFGDTVTTDHISPAGNIARNSPAAQYLTGNGIDYRDYNSYGSRRGNHEVMMRGTFANIRLKNDLANGKLGGYTSYKGELTTIFDAAMQYKEEGIGTLIIAGKDYGMGSSRDWAAKGTNLLGVKVVLAESFERIHRSNLVMMGVLPVQFLEGENADSLGLTGYETYSFDLPEEPGVHDIITVRAEGDEGVISFQALVRFDADADIRYYKNGGILPMVVRKKLRGVAYD